MRKETLLVLASLLLAFSGCTTRNPHHPDAAGPAAEAGVDSATPTPDRGPATPDARRPDRGPVAVDSRPADGPLPPTDGPPPDLPAADLPALDGPTPDAPSPKLDGAAPDVPALDQALPPDQSGCPPGTTKCAGVCVDAKWDNTHCGKCGNACGPGTGCVTGACLAPSSWRSTLYPHNWKPGYQDSKGRQLHDFSFAGYQRSELSIPDKVPGVVVNVTGKGYDADNAGKNDATAAIQKAILDVGSKGGGVVWLPAGTYKVKPPKGASAALWIKDSKVVIRGAGRARTFIHNTDYKMRGKAILSVRPAISASWTSPDGAEYYLSANAQPGEIHIPVATTSLFSKGDLVVMRADATSAWVKEHGMSGIWTAANVRGPMFLRRVTGVSSNKVTVDIPLRYPLLTRDKARIYLARGHLREVGLEDFSIGNAQHPGTSGWGDNDYNSKSKSAYDVHASRAISMAYTVDSWIRRVNSYQPKGNSKLVHTLSDGIQLYQSRNVTVQDCVFAHPQYEGGGGNGYTFVMQGSDNLLDDCASISARHAYSFKSLQTTGNVIRRSSSVAPRLATDFHMHLSAANLLERLVLDRDFVDATYRPYGTTIHGHTTTQSVMWNTRGIAYHKSAPGVLVDSRQYGWGVVAGTSGPAFGVRTTPLVDTKNTAPEDLHEGMGGGAALGPASLYADQLYRRTHSGKAPPPAGPNMVALAPVADAYVRDGSHAKTNYGADTYLVNKISSVNSGYNRISLLRFDLNKLSVPVARARLLVYGRINDSGGTLARVKARAVNDNTWDEKKVTWDTMPKLGAYMSSLVMDSKDTWRVFDVTNFVKDQQVDGQKVSIALEQEDKQKGLVAMVHSREHSTHRPRLELIPFPGTPLKVKSIASASPAQPGSSAKNTLDGKLSTSYAAEGLGAQITFDLGKAVAVNGIAVAHKDGTKRIAYFEVHTSLDNKSYSILEGAQSAGDNDAHQFTALPKTQARYVRYVGLGNSKDLSSEITEVQIYGP